MCAPSDHRCSPGGGRPVPPDPSGHRSTTPWPRVTPAALLVLDHLEDPRNVGAIARSAVAAGMGALVVPEHRAAPLEATAFKAAAGAFEHLVVAPVSSVANAVAHAEEGWGCGRSASTPTATAHCSAWTCSTEPVAVVVGAEGEGLSRLVRERCDVIAGIPIDPRVESLNASVAAALAVFEVARVRAS